MSFLQQISIPLKNLNILAVLELVSTYILFLLGKYIVLENDKNNYYLIVLIINIYVEYKAFSNKLNVCIFFYSCLQRTSLQIYMYMYIVYVYFLSHVQLFCSPMDCSPPGSSVHGILQARILDGVALSFSRTICVYVYIYIHFYMYVYIYIYTHTHTHFWIAQLKMY